MEARLSYLGAIHVDRRLARRANRKLAAAMAMHAYHTYHAQNEYSMPVDDAEESACTGRRIQYAPLARLPRCEYALSLRRVVDLIVFSFPFEVHHHSYGT